MAFGSCELIINNTKITVSGDITTNEGVWDGEKYVMQDIIENNDTYRPETTTVKTVAPSADLNIRDSSVKSLKLPAGLVTAIIRTNGSNTVHYYNNYVIAGTGAKNNSNGEITGFSLRQGDLGTYDRVG